MSQAYQRESIRRVCRLRGHDVWEWRYRVHGKMRQEKFSVGECPTERALWTHLETSVRLLNLGAEKPVSIAPTMGAVIDRYRAEYLPTLAKSTRNTDGSMLKVHIEPRWGSVGIPNVSPMAVDAWLKSLAISSSSKGRARRLLKQLIDKAMFWELIPRSLNPMTLVRVKGVSKRVKKVVLLSPEQVVALIAALEEPYKPHGACGGKPGPTRRGTGGPAVGRSRLYRKNGHYSQSLHPRGTRGAKVRFIGRDPTHLRCLGEDAPRLQNSRKK